MKMALSSKHLSLRHEMKDASPSKKTPVFMRKILSEDEIRLLSRKLRKVMGPVFGEFSRSYGLKIEDSIRFQAVATRLREAREKRGPDRKTVARALRVPDSDVPYRLKDEKKMKLQEVVSRTKERFQYDYDFGDGWQHEILVEEILKPDLDLSSPTCIGGERACPPEDCGGVPGYAEFLEAIRDPKHEQHDEMLEWIGGEFDPEEFDIVLANRGLKRIK